jgi:hypothetical protein
MTSRTAALLLCLAQVGAAQSGWKDDFENYSLGAFPSAWTYSGNSNISVTADTVAGGKQSARLYGIVGGNWAAVLHRQVQVSPPFTIEYSVRNGNEAFTGVKAMRSYVALSTGPSWTYSSVPLGGFNQYGAFSAAYDQTQTTRSIAPLTWSKVRIIYERPDSTHARITYYINGVLLTTVTRTLLSFEGSAVWLSPDAEEGSVWYDDISVTAGANPPASPAASRFVPVAPCRIADTRNATGTFGGPVLGGGATRTFPIVQSACGIPSTATAYSLNFTVVPSGALGYLTAWPSGQIQPLVSTLNSPEGKIVANAAIVPAGSSGGIDAYATNATHLVIDINGYFDATSTTALPFFTSTPCRLVDTRLSTGSLGGPRLAGGTARSFPLSSSPCSLPAGVDVVSLNATVVPQGALGYLTLWPSAQSQPLVSTLNSPEGRIVANAAIVPTSAGSVSAYATNATDLVLDANGYFAATGSGTPLSFFSVQPCRIADTRLTTGTFGGPRLTAGQVRSIPVTQSTCGIPATAKAFALNVTVVPQTALGYLTIWPSDQVQPLVSTLNSPAGVIVANAALVPAAADGSVSIYVTNATDVIVDVNGYFAPAIAGAQFTADQVSQPTNRGWTVIEKETPVRTAQTFQPSLPVLNAIDVDIITGNPGYGPDTITMRVRNSGGTVIASASRYVLVGQSGPLRFQFSDSGVAVTPGATYTMEVEDTGRGTFGWEYGLDPYPRGQALFEGHVFQCIGCAVANDFAFATYGSRP